jgi:hypothetical protein
MPRLPLIRDSAAAPAPRFPPIQLHAAIPVAVDTASMSLRVARTDLHFDGMQSLAGPHSVFVAHGAAHPVAGVPDFAAAFSKPDFIGSGWLGQTLRGFRCRHDAVGQHVLFDDGAGFWVGANGDRIAINAAADASAHRDEMLLGPALLLALSMRGIFGLHASSVLGSEGAVALLGPSGSGKSSLARYAVSEGALRLSDDVTPVASMDAGLRVLPRFPQLKLAPVLMVDDLELPLAALVWMELAEGPMALVRMSDVEASRCLLRDTVAARLFAPGMLSQHLDFCVELARRTAGWRLTLPRVEADQLHGTLGAAYRLLRGLGLP